MSITYVGRYHVVLMQPPDGRVDAVRRLHYVLTVTNAVRAARAAGGLTVTDPQVSGRAFSFIGEWPLPTFSV